MTARILKLAGALALAGSLVAHADGPPQSNGIISNPTLVQNQDVAKAQAAGAISMFMNQGAQSCDSDGKNCHSLFGQDDTPDYTTLQQSSQNLTGVQAFSFLDGEGGEDGGSSKSIASQLGTLAVACGDLSVKKVAGIVVKLSDCQVTATGDAKVTVQVCTAPVRSNPVTPPKNEVTCSNDPTASNFRPPAGYVCHRPACDTEPVGSLDGWSQPQTISWQSQLPTTATADEQSKNGLGLIFYPPLNGQVASFTADSDNMTAVKIVQSFVNNQTKRTAVGLKVAYRHKTQVTKDMMVAGPSSVPNPSANTAQWDSITKLQGNEKIPQFQKQYAANGTECLQQIQGGIAKDGKISVCDQTYTNESGIKPLAKTAQVATEGQDCGTTPQCLNKVVNTTTWTEMCSTEVPMAMRNCTTKQDYTIDHLSYTRTRTQEICHETRSSAEYACTTSGSVSSPGCVAGQPCVRVSTCTVGQQYAVQMVDTSGMSNDDCQGGDYVSARWTCSLDDAPTISMGTNHDGGWETSAVVPNNGSALVSIDGTCYGKFENQTACVNGQCSGQYTMRIGVMACGGPVMTQLQTDAQNASCAWDDFSGSYKCTTTDTNAACTGIADDNGYMTVTCTQKSNPANSCTTGGWGGTNCTCSDDNKSFQERSFGSSSSITAKGMFSMAAMYSISLADQCTPYY